MPRCADAPLRQALECDQCCSVQFGTDAQRRIGHSDSEASIFLELACPSSSRQRAASQRKCGASAEQVRSKCISNPGPLMSSVNSQFGGFTADLTAPVVPASVAKPWAFELHRGLAGLAELREEWQGLLGGMPAANYLQSPQWIASYMSALAPAAENVHLIAARRGAGLDAVFALESVAHGVGAVRVPGLRLISGDHMHLSDLAISGKAERLWAEFRGWLEQQRELSWQVFSAKGVCVDAVLGRLLNSPLARQDIISRPHPPTAWLDCSQGAAHALKDVGRGHTGNVKRLLRRARELGPLSYEAVTDGQHLHAALQSFLRVEGSGWKDQAGSAIQQDPKLMAFYTQLARDFGSRGACRINLLRLNGEVIAAQFGLVSNRQLNLLKIGYEPRFAQLAPGHLIMRYTIDSVCADASLDRLSFVTNPPWAHLWKPQHTEVENHLWFRRSLMGQALRGAARAWTARPRLRRTR